MDPQLTHQSLESFLYDLDRAVSWLRSFGIHSFQTRFSAYRKMLSVVLQHRRAGTAYKLPNLVPPEDYLMAFIQSTDLVGVWKTFQRRRGPRFVQKLLSSTTGPINPVQESPRGANSRDTLFELSVAAFFRSRKTPVLVGSNKDLILKFGSHTLFAECKRPRRVPGVRRAVEDSTEQLIKYFGASRRHNSKRLWGFIALDISLLVNPQHNVLTVPDVRSIGQLIDSFLTRFMQEHAKTLAIRSDERILGVLAFLKLLVFDTTQGRNLDCQKFGMFSHAEPNTPAFLVADELYRRLLPNLESV
jgi:hypothetical protein